MINAASGRVMICLRETGPPAPATGKKETTLLNRERLCLPPEETAPTRQRVHLPFYTANVLSFPNNNNPYFVRFTV